MGRRGGPENIVRDRGSLQQPHRRRREHAQAAEGTSLVAGHAGLEALRAGRAGGAEVDLLLGRDGHVEEELWARAEHARSESTPWDYRLAGIGLEEQKLACGGTILRGDKSEAPHGARSVREVGRFATMRGLWTGWRARVQHVGLRTRDHTRRKGTQRVSPWTICAKGREGVRPRVSSRIPRRCSETCGPWPPRRTCQNRGPVDRESREHPVVSGRNGMVDRGVRGLRARGHLLLHNAVEHDLCEHTNEGGRDVSDLWLGTSCKTTC